MRKGRGRDSAAAALAALALVWLWRVRLKNSRKWEINSVRAMRASPSSALAGCARESQLQHTHTRSFLEKRVFGHAPSHARREILFRAPGHLSPTKSARPRSPRPLGGLVNPLDFLCAQMHSRAAYYIAPVFTIGAFGPCCEIRTRDQLARTRATHKALTQGFLNKTLFATSVSRKNLKTG